MVVFNAAAISAIAVAIAIAVAVVIALTIALAIAFFALISSSKLIEWNKPKSLMAVEILVNHNIQIQVYNVEISIFRPFYLEHLQMLNFKKIKHNLFN